MHGETKDERLQLRVSSLMMDRAEKWAERQDVSLSAYVRTAIEQKMDEDLLNDIQAKTQPTDGD